MSAIAPANSIGNTHSSASTTATEITIRQNIRSPRLQRPYYNRILSRTIGKIASGCTYNPDKEGPQWTKRQGKQLPHYSSPAAVCGS
jgi:hypothetical protein